MRSIYISFYIKSNGAWHSNISNVYVMKIKYLVELEFEQRLYKAKQFIQRRTSLCFYHVMHVNIYQEHETTFHQLLFILK